MYIEITQNNVKFEVYPDGTIARQQYWQEITRPSEKRAGQ